MAYNSSYTGAQIDAAVGAVRQKESIWDAKETPAGAQQKADAAKSAAIQASDPAGSASTVQQNLNSHTGNSAVHVTSSDKQNWNSKAPGSLTDTVVDLSSTLNGHTSNGNIHVTSADKEKWDGYSTVHTLSYYKSGVTHYLTGLSGVSGTVSCVFKATANFNAGDTIRIDGTAYTIQLSNGGEAEDNLFVSGATVAVVVDKAGTTINFKAGGGLSNSRLALATATAADVAEGKTFYAGNKTLKTGTLVPYKYATGMVRMPLNKTPQVGDTVLTISGLSFRPFLLVVRSYEGAQNYPLWDRFLTCVNEPDSDTTLTGFLVNLDLGAGYDDATWPVAMTTQQGGATVRITEDWGAQEIYPANCYYYAVGL